MPPSNENICQKSSAFFFVNDYLYRPVNEEEVQRKPNVSLRYSDRYYPQNYFGDAEEGLQPQQVQSQHVPQRVPLQQGLHTQAPRRTAPQQPAPQQAVHYQPTPRPSAAQQPSYRQANPSNQVSMQALKRHRPCHSVSVISIAPFRLLQVFHSPEEVNIPLQLRRPVATTARSFQPTVASDEYEDDEPVYRQG